MPVKPSEKEEEYFVKQEFERKKKVEAERQARMAEEEKRRLKELHHMHCPKCGMSLVTIDYKGIAVDRCTGCEGLWLDYGELEAITKLEKTGLDRLFSLFRK
jgi:hypothetical protein